MLKVIIVDDEPLVRVGLRSMLRWEEHGYQICGEAPNGQLGLDLILKYQPDIVITDIKMPVMDGLEMMRLVTAAKRPVKFIILSSYDEFHLVKQAMKLGAEEYLIKLDLEPELLAETLAAVQQKIRSEQGQSAQTSRLQADLRENVSFLREVFFKRIISKASPSGSDLPKQAEYLGIALDEMLACALVQINSPSVLEKYDYDEGRSFETSLVTMITEIVNDMFKGYTVSWNPGEFIIIFSGDSQLTPEQFRKKAITLGERLIQLIKQYFNLAVSIGVSDAHHGYHQLAQAYFECCQAAQQSYYTGAAAVLCYAELNRNNSSRAKFDSDELKQILPKAIELHDLETINSVFEMLAAVLQEPLTRQQAYDLCFQIAYLVNGAASIKEADLKAIIGYQQSLTESILTLNTAAELREWLIGLERRLCRFIAQSDAQKNNRLIAKAKRYIQEHCREEISLNEVAAAINISAGYLSTIFRQETGVCFTDYVTETKIDQAKRLLRESDYKIYEISALLGYQNAYYFSKVFKKITGLTPSEFSAKQ